MPELPEVEVVRRGVAEHAVGRMIRRAEFRGARVARRHDLGPVDLADRLAGAHIAAAQRRGKYLWLVVESPGGVAEALVVHLGMSGQLLVARPGAAEPKHLHAVFHLADTELRFVDQRTFGGISLHELVHDPHATYAGVPDIVAHIAQDPMEPSFDPHEVAARIARRRSGIKRVLLDQTAVSGIGNIYADEALWRARVHGEHPANELPQDRIIEVLDAARAVMADALAQGGTSFDALYVNVNGQSGYFDRSLNAYGRAGKPCRRCGTTMVRETFMNRGSHFCPGCQPLQ